MIDELLEVQAQGVAWLIPPHKSESEQLKELLSARAPCARSSCIVHRQGKKESELRRNSVGLLRA